MKFFDFMFFSISWPACVLNHLRHVSDMFLVKTAAPSSMFSMPKRHTKQYTENMSIRNFPIRSLNCGRCSPWFWKRAQPWISYNKPSITQCYKIDYLHTTITITRYRAVPLTDRKTNLR